MADNTRDKLIEVSVELIMLKGFNNTGIAEILSKAGVPKGSFYYYFKSKEDLGLAVIDHYGKLLSSGLEERLSRDEVNHLAQLKRYFNEIVQLFAQDFRSCNCLLGNLGQELALQSGALRDAVYRHYRRVEDLIHQCLEKARLAGELGSDTDTRKMARLLFASWEGSLTRAKLEQSTQPLEDLLDVFFGKLLI
jgi:TetR/AcrR family transcriptional repressor of nem operon